MHSRERRCEIGDAMRTRQQTGEDRSVGSVRDWAGRERLREANAIFRQSVQSRGLNTLVTIAMDMIGTKRIDGHQVNVRLRRPLLRYLRRKAARSIQEKNDQNFQDVHGSSDKHNQPPQFA